MADLLLMNPIIAILSFGRGDVSLEKKEMGGKKESRASLCRSFGDAPRSLAIARSCVPRNRPYLIYIKCDGLDPDRLLNALSWSLWLKNGQCITSRLG